MATVNNTSCECGRPATVKRAGVKICRNCDRIEQQQRYRESTSGAPRTEDSPSTETYHVCIRLPQ